MKDKTQLALWTQRLNELGKDYFKQYGNDQVFHRNHSAAAILRDLETPKQYAELSQTLVDAVAQINTGLDGESSLYSSIINFLKEEVDMSINDGMRSTATFFSSAPVVCFFPRPEELIEIIQDHFPRDQDNELTVSNG